jgi:hypothetical protein
MRAANVELFRTLGDWVTSTPDAAVQRTFATASHRHAWHADLWTDRTPAVPGLAVAESDSSSASSLSSVSATERAGAYRAVVDALVDELGSVRDRIDPLLDPSTRRVIDLVTTDLESIRAQL